MDDALAGRSTRPCVRCRGAREPCAPDSRHDLHPDDQRAMAQRPGVPRGRTVPPLGPYVRLGPHGVAVAYPPLGRGFSLEVVADDDVNGIGETQAPRIRLCQDLVFQGWINMDGPAHGRAVLPWLHRACLP